MSSKPIFVFIHTDPATGLTAWGLKAEKGCIRQIWIIWPIMAYALHLLIRPAPSCIPQRLSLLTGQLASTHGVLVNSGIPEFPMENNLPKVLGAGDYQTALVGRGFHTYPENNPVGFEYYKPGDPSSELKDNFDYFFKDLKDKTGKGSDIYYANGTQNNSVIGNPYHLPNELHHTQWTTEQALDFLKQRDKNRSFFLSIGYHAPHGPQNPPAEFFNRYYYGQEDTGRSRHRRLGSAACGQLESQHSQLYQFGGRTVAQLPRWLLWQHHFHRPPNW